MRAARAREQGRAEAKAKAEEVKAKAEAGKAKAEAGKEAEVTLLGQTPPRIRPMPAGKGYFCTTSSPVRVHMHASVRAGDGRV